MRTASGFPAPSGAGNHPPILLLLVASVGVRENRRTTRDAAGRQDSEWGAWVSRRSRYAGLTLSIAIAVCASLCAPAAGLAAAPMRAAAGPTVAGSSVPAGADTGRVLFTTAPGVRPGTLSALGVQQAQLVSGDVRSAPVPAGMSAEAFARELVAGGAAAVASPDYVRTLAEYTGQPDDPDFNSAQTSKLLSAVATTRDGGWATGNASYDHWHSWWERDTAGTDVSMAFDQVWPHLDVDGAAGDARAAASQVKVAVLDTGFYMTHPDRGANIVAGKDELKTLTKSGYTTDYNVTPAVGKPTADDPDPMLDSAHGTMVASEIAQATDNGVGGAGAAWDTKVVVYKVAGIFVDGSAQDDIPAGSVGIDDDALIRAIDDAVSDGCRVINMSLGGAIDDPVLDAAIDEAYSKGVLVVAAAGNQDAPGDYSRVEYPAAAAHVVAVGAYGLATSGASVVATAAYFSNHGAPKGSGHGVDVSAPGMNVWGPSKPGYVDPDDGAVAGYYSWNGTSMASPLAAAEAALLLRFDPTLTADQLAGYMESTAVAMGAPGLDPLADRAVSTCRRPTRRSSTTGGWGRTPWHPSRRPTHRRPATSRSRCT